MSEELKSMEELRKIAEDEKKEKKSIVEVSVEDIEYKIDKTKSFEDQAADIVGAMATAKAVSDDQVQRELADKKAEELKTKASARLKDAQTQDLKAETAKLEAERNKNEAVLQTFGINKHLPDWLLHIMVVLFSPLYIILTIVIGFPCGVVKVLIDNIDNILVRYEKADVTNKPKIKVTVWIVLIGGAISVITYAVLNFLGVI